MKPMPFPRPAVARCAAPCRASPVCSSPALVPRVRRSLRACAVPQATACAPARSGTMQRQRLHCTSTMHQHRCSSLVLSRARAFRLAAGGAFFRTARWVARFSASRECVPSQEQHAPRSAPALLVCSHVVFCFRCAQVLSSDYAPSLWEQCHRAVGASDQSGVSLPPVSVARRRSSSHLAARALLARSPVAFCFCCAHVQPRRNCHSEQQSHHRPTVASESGAFWLPAAAASEQQATSDPCISTSHSLCSSTCTSTCTSTEQVSTLQDVNGMFNIQGYSSAPAPTSRSRPRITVQRSGARDEQELIETLKVQFTLEFEINHGRALREHADVWERPVDTARVAREVFHPAIERAVKQSCAWCRTGGHKRRYDCLPTSVPPLAYGAPAQRLPPDEPAATLLHPAAPPDAFRPRPLRSHDLPAPASCAPTRPTPSAHGVHTAPTTDPTAVVGFKDMETAPTRHAPTACDL